MEQPRNLTNLIKDIVFYYIKFYYDKELTKKNIKKMEESDIEPFVNEMYGNNPTKINKYIRNSLKESQGENYNKLEVGHILMKMFNDIEYAKNRVINEIKTYQENNQLGSE